MKVKIYNDLWKVKLVNADAKKMNPDKDHINFGLTEYAKGKISIRAGLSESVARSTVIHELVHAFSFSYGFHLLANEETEESVADFFGTFGDEIIRLADQIMKGVVLSADNRRNQNVH